MPPCLLRTVAAFDVQRTVSERTRCSVPSSVDHVIDPLAARADQ